MVAIKKGERVRFSALPERETAPDPEVASSLRPGEVWEGVVTEIAWDGESGRQLVTVRIDRLNGGAATSVKEVYADSVSWEQP